MKGIVIEKGEKYFTFLGKIFTLIHDKQNEYNWLITGYECYPQSEEYVERLSGEYCWISGTELTDMIRREDFQWIWGVFSAFPKEISEQTILQYEFPKADGYQGFWRNPISIQHPLAEVELVAWDSSMTVVIAKDDNIVDLLQKGNIWAEDLETYNKE